jgi:hypothetical protein
MLRTLQESYGSDAIGRLIAYGGGSTGVAVTRLSEATQSSAVYDWGYWIFATAIFGRLVFDVYKYIKGQNK